MMRGMAEKYPQKHGIAGKNRWHGGHLDAATESRPVPTIQFQSPDISFHLPHYGKKTHANIHAKYHLNPEFHVYENILNA